MTYQESTSGAPERALRFVGRWQDFAAIAAVNLLLTIVTLGIYRFWAIARSRRYLWSNTRVIDDELEWTGTGGEMFVGFLIVAAVLIAGWIGLGLTAMLLTATVGEWAMIPVGLAVYIGIIWLVNFAKFRAVRYRLARTWWRGIRGGSDSSGSAYANGALGRAFLAFISFGILTPAALTGNWNARMNEMSFGPDRFEAFADTDDLQSRWMIVWAGYLIIGATAILAQQAFGEGFASIAAFIAMIGVGAAFVAFYSLYFRKLAADTRLGNLSMSFDAHSKDWVILVLKMIGLAIVTIGFGVLMWQYMRWKFVIDHSEIYGEIDLDRLTQSTTTAPRDAEGFAEAFDIGAF